MDVTTWRKSDSSPIERSKIIGYARQDGTLAYFFDLDEVDDLFQRHGLKKRKNTAIRRCIRNRKTNCEMHRVWIQSIYEKMLIIC